MVTRNEYVKAVHLNSQVGYTPEHHLKEDLITFPYDAEIMAHIERNCQEFPGLACVSGGS